MSTETETPAQPAAEAPAAAPAPAPVGASLATPSDTTTAPANSPESGGASAAPTGDRPARTGRGSGRRGEGPDRREGAGRREGGDRDRRGPRRDRPPSDPNAPEMVEKIVYINRCAKVVKGGRRFSFAALAVVGDKKGSVGIGYGKANEVPDAIKKSTEHAKKRMVTVKLKGDTIPHEVYGEYDGGKVLLRPAVTGTGLIAGGAVRAVLEAAGIKHILTKSMGSKNHIAVVHATLNGLRKLRLADQIKTARTTTVAPAE